MAFNTAEGRSEYTASSAQTAFTFTFKIYATSDIKVYQTPSGDTPNDTTDLLTLTTDYTVSINGDDGGTVTLVTGTSTGDTIVLVRSLPLTRTTDYQDNGDLLASTLDTDQNYQTYLIVDSMTQLERTLTLGETSVGVSLNLPSPIADAYLKWNVDADAIENDTTIPDNVTLSQTAATTATTQAGLASTSATSAQLSAWEAEAEKMTADSYATEAEDVFVKSYTSDGDGTFTATDTTDYSALHWAAKASDSVVIDATPTDGSVNAVSSNGVFDALELKAPINSPTFTGNPTAPTPSVGDNDTSIATTAFVIAEISNDIGVANSALVKTALNAGGDAPIYACRAWVNFNGTGTVAIRASGNVSSITDNGTGDYTVNFTIAMPDSDYSFSHGSNFPVWQDITTVMSSSQIRVQHGNAFAGTPYDAAYATVSIFR